MKRALILSLAATATSLSAAPGGEIATMAVGQYRCELPGDATGPAGRHVADADFAVLNASSYQSSAGAGSYLLTGDTLTMTSGPMKGNRFRRVSMNFLRLLAPDGQDSPLRCIRTGANR